MDYCYYITYILSGNCFTFVSIYFHSVYLYFPLYLYFSIISLNVCSLSCILFCNCFASCCFHRMLICSFLCFAPGLENTFLILYGLYCIVSLTSQTHIQMLGLGTHYWQGSIRGAGKTVVFQIPSAPIG